MALDADLARIEAAALRARSVRDFLAIVDRLRLLDADAADELAGLVRRLGSAPSLGVVLRQAMVEAALAAAAAVAASAAIGRLDARLAAGLEARVRRDADARAAELDAKMRAAFMASRQLAAGGADVATIRAPILGAGTSVRATLATELTQTASLFVKSVSDETKVATVWVAETNACVHCLAYSGVVAAPGKDFPGGLTYGARPRSTDRVAFPPLHPNCRCFIEPLGSQEYADALRREADRSVLRGFSLESEPTATRVEAAARLLERGVDAPASVIAYAERSVGAGRFATRDRPRR